MQVENFSGSAVSGAVLQDAEPFEVIRRNGAVVRFDPGKISAALGKAFLAVEGSQGAISARQQDLIARLTRSVVQAFIRRLPGGGTIHIEDIQDQVELALMRSGEHDVARAYVLYREHRTAERALAKEGGREETKVPKLYVLDGERRLLLNCTLLLDHCREACSGLVDVSPEKILESTLQNLYDGVPMAAVRQSLVLSARSLIEREPNYSKVAARLLLRNLRLEVLGDELTSADMGMLYAEIFPKLIETGVKNHLLDPRMREYDLLRLGRALSADRDLLFDYLGLQTLYDRYLLHVEDVRIELPQTFFMRVAMGLALNEVDREARAIEFYHLLSSFDFMCSTPTLFNSGTCHSQLSSCYLTTVEDDLDSIYQAVKENALLQKYAGGLGNDWTPVRSLGSKIKGTNGKSQGVIPFLKVVNDTAVAVNQGGKRKGAVCAYLESWHLDIEEFLELRKNTGDDRRRMHDMNTANWIPDLFMRRVMEDGQWTLFSPSDTPDLHEKFGKTFEQAYIAYEAKVDSGEIKLFKRISAVQLWRKMLTMLFETGHPWITFKDACNLRSPQQHVGVIHSSNLCTEITLNTSHDETAVCNLGSINLVAHLMQQDKQYVIDSTKLAQTVRVAMRMLDNVIDLNFYPTPKARKANLRHRPVGLGVMGYADSLRLMNLGFASTAAVEFADRSMEVICYEAYSASCELAQERGVYSSYAGSLWDQGVLPPDSLNFLEETRSGYLDVDRSQTLDWDLLRMQIKQHGMRNSNCVAIAPTATISNIVGVSACIEPDYQNLYVKSNLSGEFIVINANLVRELKSLALWDDVMIADLKYFDGSLAPIDRIPEDMKKRYATAFEIDPIWLIEAASRRQKWIDQAQSLNLYIPKPSGKELDKIYKLAWIYGLKTTYYLRTLGATTVEKNHAYSEINPKFCAIDNPECESCQ